MLAPVSFAFLRAAKRYVMMMYAACQCHSKLHLSETSPLLLNISHSHLPACPQVQDIIKRCPGFETVEPPIVD
jgi:hypothetical protein